MATDTEETQATQHQEALAEVDQAKTDAMLEAAKVEGEEAMRIAKINHPEVDWQADPVTGAPLVGGTGSAMTSPEPQEPADEDSPAAIEARTQSGAGLTKEQAKKQQDKTAKDEKAYAEAVRAQNADAPQAKSAK